MAAIEERVRALEVEVQFIGRQIERLERRMWAMGIALAGLCNALQLWDMVG